MQYWQRRLQRSVTDTRRLRRGRLKRSRINRSIMASSLPAFCALRISLDTNFDAVAKLTKKVDDDAPRTRQDARRAANGRERPVFEIQSRPTRLRGISRCRICSRAPIRVAEIAMLHKRYAN